MQPFQADIFAPRRYKALTAGLLGVAALLTATGIVLGLRGVNAGPVIDSGIAECDRYRGEISLADGKEAYMKEFFKQMRAIREQYANSSYADLRDAGTEAYGFLLDSTDSKGYSIPDPAHRSVVQVYNALVRACINHGVARSYIVPPPGYPSSGS